MLLSVPFAQSGAFAGRMLESIAPWARSLAGAFARAARARAARRRIETAYMSDHVLRDLGLDRITVACLDGRRVMPRGPIG